MLKKPLLLVSSAAVLAASAALIASKDTNPVQSLATGEGTTIYFDFSSATDWAATGGGKTRKITYEGGEASMSAADGYIYKAVLPEGKTSFTPILRDSGGTLATVSAAITFNANYNLVKMTSYDVSASTYTYNSYLHKAAANSYACVNISAVNGWWETDTPSTFFDTILNGEHTARKMTRNSKITDLYTYKFKYDTYFTMAIVVRGASDFDGTDWSKKWTQTNDITYSPSNDNLQVVNVLDEEYLESKRVTLSGDSKLGDMYGSYFLGLNLCKDEEQGGGMVTPYDSMWNNARNLYYNDIYAYLNDKTYLKNFETSLVDESQTNLAMRRYDMIVSKHGAKAGGSISDFIERDPSPAAPGKIETLQASDNDTSLIAITGIATLGVVAFGSFFLYKKRHQ